VCLEHRTKFLERANSLPILLAVTMARPNGRTVSPAASYLERPQVTKGSCSRLGPTSSGTFTQATLRGPAPNGHPCPDGALAASIPLDPLHATCVQPAPKSRSVVSRLSRSGSKNHKQMRAPAVAMPSPPPASRTATGFVWMNALFSESVRSDIAVSTARSNSHNLLATILIVLPVPGRSPASQAPTPSGQKQNGGWRLFLILPGGRGRAACRRSGAKIAMYTFLSQQSATSARSSAAGYKRLPGSH
jgi:hypothetical protein